MEVFINGVDFKRAIALDDILEARIWKFLSMVLTLRGRSHLAKE
ncbi:hypothetical protein [Nodularia chucula]